MQQESAAFVAEEESCGPLLIGKLEVGSLCLCVNIKTGSRDSINIIL